LEIAMTYEKSNKNNAWSDWTVAPATSFSIEAAVKLARAERAQHVRKMAVSLSDKLKRIVAGFRPIRSRTPHSGALA
jgi:hypothetical protein